jgi:predicted DNA-binding transcriptional regulator AlpA
MPLRAERLDIEKFDQLPDDAYVRLPVVAALLSVSTATVWRWSKAEHIPAPVHIQGVTFWSVGELREHFRTLKSQRNRTMDE